MTTTLSVFSVSCPSCLAEFPVDSAKVPVEGIHAICSECARVFPVERPEDDTREPIVEITDDAVAPEVEVAADDSELPGPTDEPEFDVVEPAAGISDDGEVEPEPAPVEERPFEDLRSLATEAISEPDDSESETEFKVEQSTLSRGQSRFGQRDPHDRARRLARVLVSDIIAYHPARYRESYARGTLKNDFEEEVGKSWKEYVDQIGIDLAESTPYFSEALNEILGKGDEVF